MASDRQRFEEGSTDDDDGPELNTSPTDELAAVSASARGAGELMMIQRLLSFIEPMILRIVKEEFGLVKQELLAASIMKENPANRATTKSVTKRRLKLQFRNRIFQPVYTGKPILGENETAIEIALVDAFTEQIINTGVESTAKLQIVGFRVGDSDSWTFEEFQESVNSEKKGKRILQGNTCLQLKDGVCFVSNKINFTHNSQHTKNGFYRLGAGVVDVALMNRVEVARTEAFLLKDGRTIYSEKYPNPRLSDEVFHLKQISRKGKGKGTRYGRLKDAGVLTVKDLLTLLYTDPKRLQDILNVRASSDIWAHIVDNARASNGMFLYLDPCNQGKTGVVLDAKLQLKGLIVKTHKYIPIDELSAKQKVDNRELVKFASQHIEMLDSFEDETSLKEYLKSHSHTSLGSLPSANKSLETSNIIDGPKTSYLLMPTETPHNLDNSNLHIGQRTPIYDRGKAIVHFDNETTYSINYHQENMPPHPHNLESPNGLHTHYHTVESPTNTCGRMNNSCVFCQCMDCQCMDLLINNPDSILSDSDFITVAGQTVSIWYY